jgi:hypothetical protein
MITGNKTVDLHPLNNNGEKTLAHVMFDPEGRVMTLRLESGCYGSHYHDVRITFDSPNQMIELANALTAVACIAQDEFRKNP